MTAAALAAAAALGAPAAHAAGVVIRVSDRETRIDEDTLRNAADVPAGTYTLRGQGVAGDAIAHPPAVSLPQLQRLQLKPGEQVAGEGRRVGSGYRLPDGRLLYTEGR